MPAHAPSSSIGNSEWWIDRVQQALQNHSTPFYLFSPEPVDQALSQLQSEFRGLPLTHWYSFKTQPLPELVRWWKQRGNPVEVVSEWEFLAALRCGFQPSEILVNGPAKHRWLGRHTCPELLVHFDSIHEFQALKSIAVTQRWSCGVRIHTPSEFDPESPKFSTQFGLNALELEEVSREAKAAGIKLDRVHFHLRTQIRSASIYAQAIEEALSMSQSAGLNPAILDVGGGFPAPQVKTLKGHSVDAEFHLRELAALYRHTLDRHSSIQQLWLENGRWMTARSGVLVVSVLDSKYRNGRRHLICDAGRTTSALISTWEDHRLLSLPERRGKSVLTTVNGPTCMAFDRLTRRSLPASIEIGDRLVWMDAGAYHLPWETRFSHGLPNILWHDGQSVKCLRKAESFEDGWRQWEVS